MNSTPVSWRVGIASAIVGLTITTYLIAGNLDPRFQSALGVIAFILVAFLFSSNLRAINWRVVGVGLLIQLYLALSIRYIPQVKTGFELVGDFISKCLTFAETPAQILFGNVWPRPPLALIVLPTVIFVATVFSILFYLRILQGIVWVLAKLMVLAMGKRGASGAETLSAVANVFMGQTEAPLIVAPYVGKMTRSELLAIMIGGMATIAGGVMAIYIKMGADAVAILATSVMAAPCGLYVAKILLPETEEPATRGKLSTDTKNEFSNVLEAAAAGASEGMKLAINIIAMLIAFLALIIMADYFLSQFCVHILQMDPTQAWTLKGIFGKLFSPVAVLMGVAPNDAPQVGQLLGIKLIGNEFLAFEEMTKSMKPGTETGISPRSYTLATYALTGFANVGSIGIQLGGIGSLPQDPAEQKTLRAKLAKLGPKALLGGFLATLINAAIAGVIL
ncbi:MAG: NupC/NupG family nucleoside CNT transporter [Fimbriiglobus sp.]